MNIKILRKNAVDLLLTGDDISVDSNIAVFIVNHTKFDFLCIKEHHGCT